MKNKIIPIYISSVFLISAYVLADSFLVEKVLDKVQASSTTTDKLSTGSVKTTDTSYKDSHIQINVTTERVSDTNVYVADITVDDPSFLKTALAGGSYGRNITATTSAIASDVGAIFAINGDYYGFRDTGYVIRNGQLFRDTAANNTEALVIDKNGNMSSANQSSTTTDQLLKDGAQQVLSFGPTLVKNSKVVVSQGDEVAQSSNSNPRTAIGQIGKNHYLIVVSDGRTTDSAGLSLMQLAQVFKDHGATYAYNLDGGGSSTMVLNGKVINNPVGGRGQAGTERAVSDIVYIGYKEQE